ncbi:MULTISPECIES: hypothetical protein [Streptomyces]|uniref:Integral membrane protein n=1 Tax=Streptomyces lichenis TaxID=2306967 RepID=A0ABT0I5E3_9ACTN|nr:hypothetical protein [Streptomyces lichenis]MCK8676546.1 hypothetical protein [Streptomyces lichenis]
MEMFFKVSFVIATVLDLAVLTALLRQGLRSGSGRGGPREADPDARPVLGKDEALSAAGFFAAAMVFTTLAAHGWDALDSSDTVLFAAVFGILTAALLEQLRSRSARLALAAYALPLAYGVLAGLAGPGL